MIGPAGSGTVDLHQLPAREREAAVWREGRCKHSAV